MRGIGVVRRDLGTLRQEVVAAVVQSVVGVGADHVGGAAVRVVGGVALLAVGNGQVLRAEGGDRLALGDAGRTSAEDKSNVRDIFEMNHRLRRDGMWTRNELFTVAVATQPHCRLPPPPLPMTLHVSEVRSRQKDKDKGALGRRA